MHVLPLVCAMLCASASLGSISVKRTGWLERAVSYYKKLFVDDVEKTAPIELRVKLQRAPPPGAKLEPEKWDYPAVERLLTLMGASERAAPVRRALRRALRPSGPTRRFITKEQSWNLFPSLGKNHPNNIYYDFDTDKSAEGEEIVDNSGGEYLDFDEDHAVLVLENPVEARLPSSMLSVKVLREILEARALAARQMPSTTKSTIPWIPMNKTSTGNKTDAGADENETTAAEGASPGDGASQDPDGGSENPTTTTEAAE